MEQFWDKAKEIIESHPLELKPKNYYQLDVEKIKSLEDVKLLLKFLHIGIIEDLVEDSDIKHLLKLNEES